MGSDNFEIRNFSINYGLNAMIYDAWLVQKMEAAFE
ncbi:hypothetical protein FHR70_002224 [Microvirga lupini]|uniref:Uncharacterized protein n=1 Tax=Microvirga lupini TaxID=420324 RepID=A0A7W4VLY1_9HYPH|nr:hypothetical protein [Microvirga lupini]